MARPGLRYEQVAEVAERLHQAGTKPTANLLLAELRTGSLSTITRHLRTWQSVHQPEPATEITAPPDGVRQVLERLWPALQREANRLIAEVDTLAQTRIEEAHQREEAMTRELERLEAENARWQDDARAQSQRLQEVGKQLAAAQERAEAATARLSDAEHQREETLAVLEKTRLEAAEARSDLKRADADARKAEGLAAELSTRLQTEQAQLAETERRAAVAEARREEGEKTLTRLEQDLTALKAEIAEHKTVVKSLREDLANTHQRAATAEQRVAVLEAHQPPTRPRKATRTVKPLKPEQ